MTGFVVQGGGYSSGLAAKNGTLAPIPLESNKGLDIMDALGVVPTAVQNTIPDVPVTEVVVKIASRVR